YQLDKKLTTHSELIMALLHTKHHIYSAPYIIQSCFDPLEIRESEVHYPLKQHFLGWEITVDNPVFNPDTCTLMDFDESFSGGVAFMYLLPWSPTTGLLEYTIFSDQLISKDSYEKKIARYLEDRFKLEAADYQITRREYGVIPMEDRPVIPWYKPHIMNIGTQGGLVKPSTGYTFTRIQQQTKLIMDKLIIRGHPDVSPASEKRFKAYDLWFLQILHDSPEKAPEIFHHLFKNNPIDDVFRFLNEDSSLFEDL